MNHERNAVLRATANGLAITIDDRGDKPIVATFPSTALAHALTSLSLLRLHLRLDAPEDPVDRDLEKSIETMLGAANDGFVPLRVRVEKVDRVVSTGSNSVEIEANVVVAGASEETNAVEEIRVLRAVSVEHANRIGSQLAAALACDGFSAVVRPPLRVLDRAFDAGAGRRADRNPLDWSDEGSDR